MDTAQFIDYWKQAIDDGEDMSLQELSQLTHETQVGIFGFCTCEEQEYFPFDDCPKDCTHDWKWQNPEHEEYMMCSHCDATQR